MRCALWNVRSLSTDMPAAICDSIVTTSRDVFVAVETWHDDALTPALALACPPGCCVVERARPRSTQLNDTTATNHGGIAVFYRSTVTVSHVALYLRCPRLNALLCVTSASHKVILVAVYRPGSATITSCFSDDPVLLCQ